MSDNFLVPWGNKVDSKFLSAVIDMCAELGWGIEHVGYMLTCIAFETGYTFSPSIKNGNGSGAVGLIQFMPSTARALGTTTAQLSAMSAIEQLQYVYKYFKPYRTKVHTLSDMYMCILLPAYVGKPDSTLVFSNGSAAYRQNVGFDANSDGKITKGEISRMVICALSRGMSDDNVLVVDRENYIKLGFVKLV